MSIIKTTFYGIYPLLNAHTILHLSRSTRTPPEHSTAFIFPRTTHHPTLSRRVHTSPLIISPPSIPKNVPWTLLLFSSASIKSDTRIASQSTHNATNTLILYHLPTAVSPPTSYPQEPQTTYPKYEGSSKFRSKTQKNILDYYSFPTYYFYCLYAYYVLVHVIQFIFQLLVQLESKI